MTPTKALAFYATDDAYAFAVLVFVTRLRTLGVGDDIGVHLLHLPVSDFLIEQLHAAGVVTQQVDPLPYVQGGYYRDCLIKLRIFTLTQYTRVVYVDADALPLRSLDGLFRLHFEEPIAAPPAYWLPDRTWGSHLLVVTPSKAAWDRLHQHFADAASQQRYDMDLINAEFPQEIHSLPPYTMCLDSEWEKAGRPGAFGPPAESFARASVVHFTALAKPWSMTPRTVRRFRPDAHPQFHELREVWWQLRTELLSRMRPAARSRIVAGGWLHRTRASVRAQLLRH